MAAVDSGSDHGTKAGLGKTLPTSMEPAWETNPHKFLFNRSY